MRVGDSSGAVIANASATSLAINFTRGLELL
jgi:hypothetical protein